MSALPVALGTQPPDAPLVSPVPILSGQEEHATESLVSQGAAVTDQEIIDAIRQNHLKANITEHEADETATIHWDRATVDRSGVFDSAPYLHVPVTLHDDECVVRVYAPAWMKPRLMAGPR